MRSPDYLLSTARRQGPGQPGALRGAQVEIVIPVRNEDRDLVPSVQRLHSYLHDQFPFSARITIADNGSTDGTWAQARALAADLPGVRATRLERPGRGGALRSIWLASDADVQAYMDVDLSTDLNALFPLVAPLLSGHSDVAIGTRLARSARVVRGPRREFISRCYNLLLHVSTDPTPTLARFKQLAAEHKIHYFVGQSRASFGGSGNASQITAWVKAHFTAQTVGGVTVYDLSK